MPEIIIYSTATCPYCDMAKNLLKQKQVEFTEIRVDLDEAARKTMMERSGRRTVPQLFINGVSIGGYDDLANLEKSGKLNELLNSDQI
jgi:glutaredoxin 3